jgi:hypothetical protein
MSASKSVAVKPRLQAEWRISLFPRYTTTMPAASCWSSSRFQLDLGPREKMVALDGWAVLEWMVARGFWEVGCEGEEVSDIFAARRADGERDQTASGRSTRAGSSSNELRIEGEAVEAERCIFN